MKNVFIKIRTRNSDQLGLAVVVWLLVLVWAVFYLSRGEPDASFWFGWLYLFAILFTLLRFIQAVNNAGATVRRWTLFFGLFLVTFLTILLFVYGAGKIHRLGFYNDDWQRVGLFNTVQAKNPLEWLYYAGKNRVLEIESRPFYRLLTLPLPFLFRNNPVYYHLFKIFLVSLSVLAIFLFLENFLPKPESWLIAFLAISWPVHTAIWFWSLTDVAVFALLTLFLSLAVYVKFLKTKQKRWLFAGWLFFVLAITSYENSIAALPIFCVLPYFLGKEYNLAVKSSLSSLTALVLLDAFYQFIFLPRILKIPFHTVIKTSTSLGALESGARGLFKVIWGNEFWGFWAQGFAYFQKMNSAWLVSGLLFLIVICLVFWLKAAFTKEQKSLGSRAAQEKKTLTLIAISGVLFLSSGFFMIFFNQFNVDLGTLSDRYTFLPSVGAGLILGGLVVLVFRQLRGVAWFVLSLLIFCGLTSQQYYAMPYQRSWRAQREVMGRVKKLKDYLGGGQKIVLFYSPPDVVDGIPTLQHYWSVVYPLQIALNNFELGADFDWGQVKDGQVLGPGFAPKKTYYLDQIYSLDF